MARWSLFALLVVACAGLAQTEPLAQESFKNSDTVRVTESWAYSNCGSPEDIVKIKSLTVSPDPPKPGENLTVNVSAYVTRVVEEGAYADVTVKLGLVKLLHKQFDLCEEARKANLEVQCPVQPGDYTVSRTVVLPKQIPKAKFTVNVRGYTGEDEDIMCLDLKVDFMRNPFPHFGL